jgi:D-alanyl-D-alanine dipeptidase
VRPVAELLPIALASTPPSDSGDFRPADLVELTVLDPMINLDIRYATTRNFLGTPLYSQARTFMQRPAAEALVRVQRSLAGEGYGLLVHDAYRPWYVTKIFWEAMPPELHEYVADPAEGSRHNRGCAVDLTLYDLKTGRAVSMPSLYDEATERAHANYTGGTASSAAYATFCGDTWRPRASRSTSSSGGTSITATGKCTRSRTCVLKHTVTR